MKVKVRRTLVAGFAATACVVGLLAAAAPGAEAASGPIFTVMNTSETLPDGVYFRNSPHTADTSRITGLGVYKNERVQLQCYAFGDQVGPYHDSLWYYVNNVTRPTVSGRANVGYLNAHYINDGKNANQVDAGVAACGSASSATLAVAHPQPTVINGQNVGFPQNAQHSWGPCTVQDFNGGSNGWVIVSYTGGTHIVRNGMLFGWFDNGGAPGRLGCPVNDEHGYMNGVRQDFQHGSLYWFSGMDHAKLIDPSREGAMQWAWSHVNTVFWPGKCLQFVVYSYINGQHWTLKGPYGNSVRAVDWWNAEPKSARHVGDMKPPRGALVFWDYWAGGTGHAALSLGDGQVISTEFGGNSAVHTFSISSFPQHYLGWVAPA